VNYVNEHDAGRSNWLQPSQLPEPSGLIWIVLATVLFVIAAGLAKLAEIAGRLAL